jgi:hypothetical protein
MKKRTVLRASAVIGTGGILMSLLNGVLPGPFGIAETRASAEEKPTVASAATNSPSGADTNAARLPDQSHAMVDVGYHFANLWFAADKENWPLAKYYLQGTRSHLNWPVSIHPVRTISNGTEVNLKGILEAIDSSFLTEIDVAITNKNPAKFRAAYRQALEGCYACHQACEKSFLRPQIPSAPSVLILNFDPKASGPQ